MANELMENQSGFVSLREKHDLGDIIKPLSKDIHLFDTFIAGTTHISNQDVFNEIKIGDTLTLRREDNKFDSNAVLILTKDNKKLGYIPEKDNIIFARLMDAGKLLIAKISDISKKGSFYMISIGIYLVDF